MSIENKTRVIHQLLSGGCDSLHLNHIYWISYYIHDSDSPLVLTSNQGLNYFFTGAPILTGPLILALIYTASQDDRGNKVMFFIVNIPSTWVPLAMLTLTFVLSGPEAAKVQATGLLAAHAHDFLTNIYPSFGGAPNYLQTPAVVERFFASTVPRIIERGYGTAIRPSSQRPSTGASTAMEERVLPESWQSRGAGHRLGGD
jgi:Derlin-2/3